MKKHFRHMALSVMLAAGMCVPGNGIVFAAPDTTGRWVNETEGWRYYNAAGATCTGWIETASGWYYLDPQTGLMKTGLQQIDGKTYYFTAPGENGIEGRLFCGWKEDADGTRRFFGTSHDGTFGAMKTGWQWIDGYCYYFAPEEGAGKGAMVKGAVTPDGYKVNEKGQWIGEDGNAHFESGKGFSSTEQKAGPGGSAAGSTTSSSGGSGSSGGSSSGGSSSGGSGSNGGSSSGNNGSSDNNGNNSGNNSSNDNNGDNSGNNGNNGGNSGNNGSDNGNNGSDNGNNGSDNGNNGSDETPEATPLLKEAQTKLVDLGWTQYAVFAFNEGSIDDYSIEVDGIDITDACTNVDDNGTIVKWQTTVWHPGTVNVTRKADGEKQSVTFSKNGDRVTEAGDADSAPANLVTNGPVSAFDYYLDNYDQDRNVRVRPGKTTFAVNGSKSDAVSEVPADYYAPNAEIDQDGKGEILVKLSLKNDEQKAWFEQLTTIKAMDTDNKVLNSNMTFTTSVEASEYGTNGVIRISLPATNMRSRGQYQLNLVSSYSKNKLTVPVELVDATEFSMLLGSLNPNPKPGECFNFDIVGKNGETFGNEILSPIYRVDLTMPSGETKTLTKISQWYEIGSMLHICGVDTDDESNVITSEAGVYTVSVYAHGYKKMEKQVEIGDAFAAKKAANFVAQSVSIQKNDDYGVDALSSATSSIGGGSSSGSDDSASGSSVVNGWLVFDHDLLANALILNEINPTDESSAVAQWYFDQSRVYVTDDTAEDFYDFTVYLNAVKDAKLSGSYLSFAQYQSEGTPSTNGRPYQIKRVLEDGKLGSTETISTMVGKDAPVLTGTIGKLGENLVLTAEDDSEYFGKIQGVYLDGSAIGLRNDDYMSQFAFSEDGSELTIYAYATVNGTVSETPQLSAGEHTLRIVAEGYKETTITLNVTKEVEVFDLSLAANPEKAEGEDETVYHAGQTVYVNASAEDGELQGDFLKNLEEVTLNGKNILAYGLGQIGGEEDYKIEDGKIILGKNLFKEAGTYTLILKANADAGYAPKTLEFEVKEAVETPAEENAVPEFSRKELVAKSGSVEAYYKLYLESDEMKASDIIQYLGKTGAEIYVDGTKLTRNSSLDSFFDGTATNVYKVPDISSEEAYLAVRLENMAGEHEVVISVPDYKDLTFSFEGDEPEQEVKETPVFKNAEVKNSSYYGDYYKITFDGENVRDFFKEDSLAVTVNGNAYTKLTGWNGVDSSTETNAYNYDTWSDALLIRPEDMTEDLEITITAEGYESLTFTVEAPSDEKVTPEFDKYTYVEAESSWDASYYRIDFTAEDDKALSEYLSDSSMVVTVNGVEYERGYSLYSSSTKKFVADGEMGAYGRTYSYLKLTTDEFAEDEANEVEISVDGYELVSFTVGKSDEIGNEDGDDDEFTPEVADTKYEKSWFGANYYQITFKETTDAEINEKIYEFVKAEDLTVSVNGTEYKNVGSSTYFGDTANNFYGDRLSGGVYGPEPGIRMTTEMFTEDVNIVEIEGGEGFGSLTVKIKKDGTLVTVDTEAAIDDIEAVVDTELPAEDEIIASDDKKEEISDEIVDEDETVTDDADEFKDEIASDDAEDTDSAEDTEDKADESEDKADAEDKSEETADDESDEMADEVAEDTEDDAEDADEEDASETEEDSDEADDAETAETDAE